MCSITFLLLHFFLFEIIFSLSFSYSTFSSGPWLKALGLGSWLLDLGSWV